jgi:putative sulfotransferase
MPDHDNHTTTPAATAAWQPHRLDTVAASIDQVFIVGTGRCGSTMLSNMVRQHPAMLSLSELFSFISDMGCMIEQIFPADLVSGAQMWALLGAQLPRLNMMLRHDVAIPEVIYPWRGTGQRFDAASGVPAISQGCLPHLTDAPDALLDQLQELVCSLPAAPVGIQYQRVFAWLAERQNATVWVERSGGGLRIVARMMQHFPRARFIHIVRDGPDTALSMSRHLGFRFVFAAFQLLEILGVDPYLSRDRRWESDLSDEQARLLPERFNQQALLDFSTPPPLCGHYWSGEICHGLKLLQTLPPERLLTIRYEDILQQARPTLAQMLEFILPGKADSNAQNAQNAAWLAQVSAMVRAPGSDWRNLPDKLREQTVHACRPGMAALEKLAQA